MSNSKLHHIYSALDAGEIENALNLINEIDEENIKPQFINGYNSLKIRLLIRKDKFEEVNNFFEKTPNLMSRDYIDLVKYLNKTSSELSYSYFRDIISDKIKLKPKDIDELIKLKNMKILNCLVGKSFKTTFEGKIINVNKVNFDPKKVKNLINNISSKINNYASIASVFKKIKYNQVIDGGNILYSSKGNLNDKSYKNLIKFYISLKDQTLLVLHSRHRSKINKFINLYDKSIKKFQVFYTPYNYNDDIYILLASLNNQSKIITNDKYGDHNVNFSSNNILKKYLDEKIISYTLKKSKYYLNKPKYSIVRKINNKLLIPSIKSGFILI